MSNKRKNKKKPKISGITLEAGKFYNVHDGSAHGHPGRIEFADKENDIYISITTRSLTKEEYESGKIRKDYIELSVPTSPDVYKSLVHRRPFKGSRLDYGNVEFPNLKFGIVDEIKIQIIKNKNPRLGKWFKNKKAFK